MAKTILNPSSKGPEMLPIHRIPKIEEYFTIPKGQEVVVVEGDAAVALLRTLRGMAVEQGLIEDAPAKRLTGDDIVKTALMKQIGRMRRQ
jgi:hypothetical protein